jgi:prephenate dehydrogenase
LQPSFSVKRLALLGVGYIGGSAVLAARRAGVVREVVGFDLSSAAGQAGVRLGVLDSVAETPQAAVAGADLVLLAAPVRSLDGLLRAVAAAVEPTATVMDVGSVKADVVATAETLLASGSFVGCHPMAGAEFSGVDAAKPDIFAERVCFVCPGRSSNTAAVATAEGFWRAIGCQAVTIDPDTHDRLMAAQSHLPHVAAFALAGALIPSLTFLDATTKAASPTTSLRDTTRIAASGPAVWRDILLANAKHVLPLIDDLQAAVADLRQAVASGDGKALEEVLVRAQACRKRLVGE